MKTSANIQLFQGASASPFIGWMVIVSFSLHVVLLIAFFFLPNLASTRTYYSPIYSVRLVNVAPSSEGEPAAKAVAEPKPASSPPAVAKPPAREKEKPISLAPSKKKEDDQGKITEAIERIRQRRQEKNLDSAIERLRNEKDARQVSSAIEGIRKRVTIGKSGAVESGEQPTGGSSSAVMSIKFKIYYNLIWQRIRSVWTLPEEALKGQKNLETIITIRIARSGQIEDMQFEKKSGNAYLDESAMRAIKKANPLPPLPPDLEGGSFDVGVRFTPSDF